ncbi:MAG TPA: hypothetical protein VFE65_23760 [Pseudonocardia sp.]|jgi:hypothetical protein|nr:hypothetical protein [Pseudonocardia sp.]
MTDGITWRFGRQCTLLLLAGVVGVVLWLAAVAGWLDVAAVVAWLMARVAWIAWLGTSLGLIGAAMWSQGQSEQRPQLDRSRAALRWWTGAAAVFAVALVAAVTMSWLLGQASHSKGDVAAARVEAVKTGLNIATIAGGVFALLLAVRRQWHQELSAQHTVLDATERRVTELYTKSADQLGSNKAPVRLAGLYALERLAQVTPDQRQTVVNVLCAYLRMPYESPEETPASGEVDCGHDSSRTSRGRT